MSILGLADCSKYLCQKTTKNVYKLYARLDSLNKGGQLSDTRHDSS